MKYRLAGETFSFLVASCAVPHPSNPLLLNLFIFGLSFVFFFSLFGKVDTCLRQNSDVALSSLQPPLEKM